MGRYIPQHVKTEVAVRDKGKCTRCGRKGNLKNPLEYHHKKPFSKGGSHTLANLILLCAVCHLAIHGGKR